MTYWVDNYANSLYEDTKHWGAETWKDFRNEYWKTYYFEKDKITQMLQSSDSLEKSKGYSMHQNFRIKKLNKIREYNIQNA